MRSLVLFVPLLAIIGSAGARPTAPTPGTGFEVTRYTVALRPDVATTAVSGTEAIVLRVTADGVTQLSFSPNALQISEATVDGVPVQVSSDPTAITFALPRALAKGDAATLRFRLAGTPARGVTKVPGGLYTGYFACDWMVCLQDSPGDKADFALDLLLPPGFSTAGVGFPELTVVAPGGMVRHEWRSTRPYSPYLFAFAAVPAGRVTEVQTEQGKLRYLDATGTNADLPKLFAQAPAIAAFFAEKAGIALPDRRYLQILVPGREAQEAASFSLIGLAELDRERVDPATAWIIAHEMAHLWWGNLVTAASWQEFWLNEGIATFMVAAWKEHSIGPAGYQQELDVARRRVAQVREAGFDKPLAWPGKYPSLAARRAVQYSKGALFLAHLRITLGEKAFWTGLRAFTQRHAGGTVTSRDFQQAMERAGRRDLTPLFVEWVYGVRGARDTATSG